MAAKKILESYGLHHYVKDIFILEGNSRKTKMPFFADGCPGIMFRQTEKDAFLLPKGKKLSDFFLYGQTIEPIEIVVEGRYKLIVFQLYPFAAKTMLGVDPKKINDDCYDLYLLKNVDVSSTVEKIMHAKTSTVQVKIIASFLSSLLPTAYSPEQQIQLAVNLILESKGKITVKKLTEQLHLTERTLQRRFVEHIGVSPKQFAKIIQFQASLSSLSDKTVSKLTEVVYESGYADQSHFIRSFKKYTGRKPSQLKKPK